ncbi:MAG: hypothetical protein FWC03_13085, partial [Treponema sp.]|nr:hypothetical protein [Treponema sp.]
PFRNFEFTAMQSLVYGQRLDLIYMIPFTYLFGAQSINGFMDNAFIGFNFRWRAFNSLLFKGQIYIDDFSFNGLVSGNPYMKAAGQIGVSWAPRDSFLSRLDFDYTAVMPYTYSHWHEPWYDRYNGLSDPSDPRSEPNGRNPLHPAQRIGNYLNYTHLGRNIGPDLEPNSDRIFLRGNIRILSNLEVNISGFLMRHGNASEGKEWLDPDHHDGTIFDSGTTDPWYGNDNPWDSDKNYYKQMYFLTQSNLEILLGGTLGAAWTIPTSFGTFSLSCDYGIQYGWNRGLEKGNNGFNHFWSIGGRWCW